jgi:16S rRNA (adenine1518-N6/adenine1519-N6)-dimethyltransferase
MTQSGSSTRQTLSYLRALFQARGIRPKSKLGQCFLVDLNLLHVLVQTAELSRDDLVLEIGAGTGSLTVQLAEQARAVVSAEVDPGFFALAGEAVSGRDHVVLVQGDALRNKNEISPDLLTVLEDVRRRTGATRVKLVANLPYAVATPVIGNLLLTPIGIERMVVTVQLEIALRLIAQPGTKDYGALSVFTQALADAELVRRLAPTVFWPRPAVASAIVQIRPNEMKRRHVGDPVRFRHFLRDLYAHRRKNLRGALSSWPSGRRPREEVDRVLSQLGIEGTVRAETLSVEQHLRLCAAFCAQGGREKESVDL